MTVEAIEDPAEVFEYVDKLCKSGDWTSINWLLRKVKIHETSSGLLTAYLMATRPVAVKLLDRIDFVRAAEHELKLREI